MYLKRHSLVEWAGAVGFRAPTVACRPNLQFFILKQRSKIMNTITLDFTPEIFSSLRLAPHEFPQALRLAAAIYWYSKGIISQEKAALLANLDRTDFLLTLAREQVDAFIVDFEDLQRKLDRG